MAQIKISVNTREDVGRASNRRLRGQGMIPGVIYSKGESRIVSVDNKEFEKLWHDMIGRTPLVTLNEGKEEIQALIQDVQRHPFKDHFVHVDFFEVTQGEEITAQAAVHITGEPEGVKTDGGTLDVNLHEIEVRSRPSNIPDFIQIEVSHLNIGDTIHVRDLPQLEGVTYLMSEDTIIVSVVGAMKEPEPEVEVVEVTDEEADAQSQSEESSENEED